MILGCDINSDDEVIPRDPLWVELIDVEDIFGPDMPNPLAYPLGSDGYQHREGRTRSEGQWCVAGDRFSSAILLAEMLAWPNPDIRNQCDDEHYFSSTEMQRRSSKRYQLMLSVLNEIGAPLRNSFEAAWRSNLLAQCPKIMSWQQALISSLNSIRRFRVELKNAIDKGLDLEIVRAGDQIRKSNNSLSKEEWKSYIDAYHNLQAKEKIEQAIHRGNEIEILGALGRTIVRRISTDQQKQIDIAAKRIQKLISLKRAIAENDDIAICELFDAALFSHSPLLSNDETKVIEQALQRRNIIVGLRSVLQTEDFLRKVQSFHSELSRDSNLLTYNDRQKLDKASRQLNQVQSKNLTPESPNQNFILSLPDNEQDVIELWQRGMVKEDLLTLDSDRQRLKAAIRRHGRVLRIRRALQKKDVRGLRRLYLGDDLAQSSLFPLDLKQQVESILSATLDQK